jgi:quercetin dioxygenase-like cupin family protein
LDQHEYEHQVYVLRGRGFLKQSDDNTSPPKKLSQGDAIFVPSNAVHQFINQDDEPLVFLCVKGNPALYASSPNTPAKRPELNFC